jgi:hypothetical protein
MEGRRGVSTNLREGYCPWCGCKLGPGGEVTAMAPASEPSVEWIIAKCEELSAGLLAKYRYPEADGVDEVLGAIAEYRAPQWRPEWPTEPGWYWCYVTNNVGQEWTHLLRIVLVDGWTKPLIVTSTGQSFTAWTGWKYRWLPAAVPAPPAAQTEPEEAATDGNA